MALRDLNIQPEYRTKISNIPKEFIVPLVQEGVLYRRAVGFFSSSALMEISKGIGTLISSGGRIQLVASPNLSKEDIEAIDKGYKTRRDVISSALLRELPDVNDLSLEEKDRFNLLANSGIEISPISFRAYQTFPALFPTIVLSMAIFINNSVTI